MAAIFQIIIGFAITRLLLSLGVGIITYGAVLYALNHVIDMVRSSYNQLPSTVLELMAIAGVPEVLGIICGAVLARATLQFIPRFGLIT